MAGLLVAAVLAVGYFFYLRHSADVPVNIISTGQKIKIKDIKMFLKGFPAQSVNEDPRKYFSEEIINVYTVRFFKFLQTQIEFTSREEHLKAVKAYLHSVLDPQKADEMFVLYEKFIDYEIGLQEKIKSWSHPQTADELLRFLRTVQDYRRDVFGADVADALWGAEVMAREYSIRKNRIAADPNLYGAEKEKKWPHYKKTCGEPMPARLRIHRKRILKNMQVIRKSRSCIKKIFRNCRRNSDWKK